MNKSLEQNLSAESAPMTPEEIRKLAAGAVFGSLMKTKSFGGDPQEYFGAQGKFKINTVALAAAAAAQSYTEAARIVHSQLVSNTLH